MSLIATITSDDNKELLWNLLYKNNLFNNISNENFNNIKNIFDRILNNTALSIPNNIPNDTTNDVNIVEINKIILQNIIGEINKYKSNFMNSKDVKKEIKDRNTNLYSKELKEHQLFLDKLKTPEKPDDIKFSEDLDEPFTQHEMDSLLESIQNERNIHQNHDHDNTIKDLNNNPSAPVSKLKISDFDNLIDNFNVIDISVKDNKTSYTSQEVKLSSSLTSEILEDEYNTEFKLNIRSKIDSMNTHIGTINSNINLLLENQKLIMKKLG